MKFKTQLMAAAIAISLCAGAAHATVYDLINQGIGPATATGAITTDGTIGALAQSNITNFAITVTDTSGSFTLNPADSNLYNGAVFGSNLTATSSGLFFDYGSGAGAFLAAAIVGGSGVEVYCVATGPVSCTGVLNNESIVVNTNFYQGPPQSGVVQIAAAAVPEPSAWALAITGFMGLGGLLRGRRKQDAIA